LNRTPVATRIHGVDWQAYSAERGSYTHYMQKEIHEQPRCLTDTMRGPVDFAAGEVTLGETGIDAETARVCERMVAVACGTSFYSAQIGKFYMESLARLTTEFDYASEYRYRDPLVDARTAVLAIT